jgi:AcrR family transcriptional regulator
MSGIREKKKKKTRQAILEAAVRLFSEKGYENTSVEALAQEAGVAKGTIYSYFRTKSEIFLAFCEDEMDYVFNELLAKTDPETNLLAQLHTLFMGQFRYVTKHNDFGRIFAREMIFPKEVSRDMSQNVEKRYLASLGDILTRAMERGELRNDLEFIFVVGHFFALYLVVLSSWYEGRFTTEKEISDALKKLLLQAMEGLATKPSHI